MEKLPIYKVELKDGEEGIYCTSLVDAPAIEVDFIALSKGYTNIKLAVNEEKRIVTGPLLIPDQLIFRRDERRGDYYLMWTADEIVRQHRQMMRAGRQIYNTSFDHETPLKDNYLLECWLIADPKVDKAQTLGYDLPAGTLMATYRIDDQKSWELIKEGKVKGFSIECLTSIVPTDKKADAEQNLFKKILQEMTKLDFIDKLKIALGITDFIEPAQTGVEYTLEDGTTIISVSGEGVATYADGKTVESGEYILTGDGDVLVVADGKFIEVKRKTEEPGAEPTLVPSIEQLKKLQQSLDAATEQALIDAIQQVIDAVGSEQKVDPPAEPPVDPPADPEPPKDPEPEPPTDPEPEPEPIKEEEVTIEGTVFNVPPEVAAYIKKLEGEPLVPPVNQSRQNATVSGKTPHVKFIASLANLNKK